MRLRHFAALLLFGLAPASSFAEEKDAFERGWSEVRSGTKEMVQSGGYAIRKMSDQTIQVAREGGQKVGRGASDVWITTELVAQFAVDRKIKARDIDIKTNNGVVQLKGTVESEAMALKAVHKALDTKGVVAVESELAYPAGPRPSKRFEK